MVPVLKDLVLIGGGHAHVAVLRRFGMRPVPGLRITVISRDIHTPYSGMLPGYVAGHYNYDDCHIDLGPLARFAGARLYHTVAEHLDTENQRVHVKGRPPVPYDVLSINTGSTPQQATVAGAETHSIPVKPIDGFLRQWQSLLERVLASQGLFRIAVVGGGAGGVELLLSVQNRLQTFLRERGDEPARVGFTLLTRDADIFQNHADGVRRRFRRILAERGVEVLTDHNVIEVTADAVVADARPAVAADAVLWVTDASAPAWPAASGLAVDGQGFIQVDEHLQSVSHPGIFVAGDVAAMPDPRPKSGVFAVRQGPVLSENLRCCAAGRPLKKYRPQKNFLGLISTGDQYAVASRGGWSMEGAWLWRWKDRIDRRFMQRFNELPEMTPAAEEETHPDEIKDLSAIKALTAAPAMRCGGCGAKIGADVLSRVMQRLPDVRRDDVLIGLDSPDDSAMLTIPADKVMVQSVDYFRAFIDDPFTFGAIATNHALGDVFAMGAEVQSVLAVATVPFGREAVVEETLYELLAGCQRMLEPGGGVLVGGHSGEGAELAFGLTVNGLVDPKRAWRKGGMREGDRLILGKAIGTGTLMAADMRAKAKGRWVDGAVATMLQSNMAAVACLRRHQVNACTDVTGFGLVGHLFEMARASGKSLTLEMDSLPLLEGAADTVAAGILSSLQPQNRRLRRVISNQEQAAQHAFYPLLFDPQTAGGLLASVPAEQAVDCVAGLHALGYTDARIIGEVQSDTGEPAITVR